MTAHSGVGADSGEEAAAAAIKAGAQDNVSKNNLARLVPAVESAAR